MIIKDINNLSIKELKQLLAQVNHDLKMNKPTIKRQKKIEIIEPSEYDIANSIAKTFTNKQYDKPVENAKLIADIQIQKDILDYLNNGNVIITAKPSNKINSKALKGARAGIRLSRKQINPLSVSLCNKVSL
jgi:CRISPR/Cas system endoribonuclease Cas6 (RAMP superfamily)